MNKSLILIFLTALVALSTSCRRDFDTVPSNGRLEFSRDTVYLDTVFTNIGSATFRLKVFNRSGSDISIPSIRLAGGENSPFRLNVGGDPGKSFENVRILERDSLFIFMETTLNISDFTASEKEFLVTDEILFDTGVNEQKVTLVSLVRDAVFLFPKRLQDGTKETLLLGLDEEGNEIRVEGFFLEDNELQFTNEKPYVIFGFAAIPPNKTLTVDAGARIHFHANSGLIAANQSTLLVNGAPSNTEALENEVIFEGDRLEAAFDDIPGQWTAIWLTAGSGGHQINHATIKNSTIGILVESNEDPSTPTLRIRNSQIYNSGSVGLLARGSYVEGSNLVINRTGQISLFLSFGGRYDFVHSTFANFLNLNQRQFPAVIMTNTFNLPDGTVLTNDLTQARFENSVIEGNASNELDFEASSNAAFNFQFVNTQIRFQNPGRVADNPLFDFENSALYENISLNLEPFFVDARNNDLRITNQSEFIGLGTLAGAARAPLDLLGTNRTASPDLGAYQNVTLEEENN